MYVDMIWLYVSSQSPLVVFFCISARWNVKMEYKTHGNLLKSVRLKYYWKLHMPYSVRSFLKWI